MFNVVDYLSFVTFVMPNYLDSLHGACSLRGTSDASRCASWRRAHARHRSSPTLPNCQGALPKPVSAAVAPPCPQKRSGTHLTCRRPRISSASTARRHQPAPVAKGTCNFSVPSQDRSTNILGWIYMAECFDLWFDATGDNGFGRGHGLDHRDGNPARRRFVGGRDRAGH